VLEAKLPKSADVPQENSIEYPFKNQGEMSWEIEYGDQYR
jgi:hypothetical protein